MVLIAEFKSCLRIILFKWVKITCSCSFCQGVGSKYVTRQLPVSIYTDSYTCSRTPILHLPLSEKNKKYIFKIFIWRHKHVHWFWLKLKKIAEYVHMPLIKVLILNTVQQAVYVVEHMGTWPVQNIVVPNR